ncbi:MAG: cysteine hydrolase [Dehalococcoidia bacterium]|nr:cysteine hydrolase [Dehalococcoidia bacterium]
MMDAPWRIDRERAALLIMDYQNEIAAPQEERDPALFERAARVVDAWRTAGLPVYHVVIHFREGYPEVGPRSRMFSGLKAAGRLREGTEGAAIHRAVAPLPGEVIVTKKRVGAFSGSDLDLILSGNDRTSLVLMGIATSGVVLSTVRAAADADYELTIIADCCADGDAEVHRVLTEKIFPRQAEVITADDLLRTLAGA